MRNIFNASLAVSILLSMFFSMHTLMAQTFSFSIDLKMGDENSDVLMLQRVLNSDPDTQVALSGAGSPGQETSFFGSLTHRAVIRFQNKYASQILHPHGLSSGTGYVGASTRSKLNALIVSDNISTTSSVSQDSTPQSGMYIDESESERLLIETKIRLSETSDSSVVVADILTAPLRLSSEPISIVRSQSFDAMPGDIVSVYGAGFSNSQRCFLGDVEILCSIVNSKETLASIPKRFKTGLYPIYFYDGDFSETIDIYIGKIDRSRSVVNSVSYENGDIVISGKNFDELNSIDTTFGLFRNVVAKNNSRIVIESDLVELSPYIADLEGSDVIPFYVIVMGDDGNMAQKYEEELEFTR